MKRTIWAGVPAATAVAPTSGAMGVDPLSTAQHACHPETLDTLNGVRARGIRLTPRLTRKPLSHAADFRRGAPVPLNDITDRVLHDLPDRGFVGDGQRAGQAVYRTLRQQYPCGGAY